MELGQHRSVGVSRTLEAMDGLVRFLKDQRFGAVSSIILVNQGALKLFFKRNNQFVGYSLLKMVVIGNKYIHIIEKPRGNN